MGIEVAHYAGHASLGIGVASLCVPISKHNQSFLQSTGRSYRESCKFI